MEYLTPEHPDAFLDFPPIEGLRKGYFDPEKHKDCPRCQGHGGWNLRLNAYPLHGKESTPENRHKHSHFRASCNHCNGWGFIDKDENCPGHKWKHEANLGNCYNRYRCIHCGKTWCIDSGD